jgi:endonuclease/exonuclease/phosphatase family metal-dependent hydrolase
MLPIQNPVDLLKRYWDQDQALVNWMQSRQDNELLLVGLQELNPALQRMRRLQNKTHNPGTAVVANGGIKKGLFGYPFFLNEGLGILSSSGIEAQVSEFTTLSGRRYQVPGLGIEANFSEHRAALAFRFEWNGLRIRFVTTHLHHGDPSLGASRRRSEELHRLQNWLDATFGDDDVQILSGDFNCYPGMKELDEFTTTGSWIYESQSPATWNPERNPLTRATTDSSPQMASRSSLSPELELSWDFQTHALDHVLFRLNPTSDLKVHHTLQMKVLFDQKPLSDHFAIEATFSIHKTHQ